MTDFQAFLSYARNDSSNDPQLMRMLGVLLQRRVQSRLVNARFSIWYDGFMHGGDLWGPRIMDAIRGSDIFIAVVSPQWYASENCLKEYNAFLDMQASQAREGYVLPVIVQEVDRQLRHFTAQQWAAYDSIRARQNRHQARKSTAGRDKLIEALADDIEGMIERLRNAPSGEARPKSSSSGGAQRHRELDPRAHDIEKTGFLAPSEVRVRESASGPDWEVVAHVAFFERLYIKTDLGRVDFSIRRALLSIGAEAPGEVRPQGDWGHSPGSDHCYYLNHRDYPGGITISIDPRPGSNYLSALPLPAGPGDNLFSRVAFASPGVGLGAISASVTVVLDIEGLHLAGADGPTIGFSTQRKLTAVIKAYVDRIARNGEGVMHQALPVTVEEAP